MFYSFFNLTFAKSQKMTEKRIAVIGAAIMDIVGFPVDELISYDSVPGKIRYGNGGVGRNMVENLLRLGLKVSFLSAFGGDVFSKQLLDSIAVLGGDTSRCLMFPKRKSAIHLAIMDGQRDMAAGIAAMDIIREITPAWLAEQLPFLETCSKIIVETNISAESLQWIAMHIPPEKLAIDLVSFEMGKKVKALIGRFGTVKVNRKEATIFSGKAITSRREAEEVAKMLLGAGCRQVYITMGETGVIAASQMGVYYIPSVPTTVANTTGAGDAFMSGVIFGELEGVSTDKCALYGMAAARIALKDIEAVSYRMTKKMLFLEAEKIQRK